MRALTIVALAALFLAVPLRAQPAPLVPDPTFGDGGNAFVDFDGDDAVAQPHAFLRLADGRLLGAGETGYADLSNQAALARYTADGQPDSTFGPDGDGAVTFAPTFRLSCHGVAFDAEGRILCPGRSMTSTAGSTHRPTLTRFTADGIVDATFGDGGVLTVSDLAFATFRDVHRLADDRLVVVGTQFGGNLWYLWRLLPDGTPDPAFNGGAVRTLTVPVPFCTTRDRMHSALTSDGRVAVGCRQEPSGALAAMRFTADGDPDSTFGGTGFVSLPVSASDEPPTAVDADGRLILAATTPVTGDDLAVLRLLPDGTLDPAFGTGGVAEVVVLAGGFHIVNSVAVRPDGRLLVVGAISSGGPFLVQLLPDGTPDDAFGPGGVQRPTIDPPTSHNEFELLAVALDDAERIVGLGEQHDGTQLTFGFARLVPGSPVAAEPGALPAGAALHAPAPNPAAGPVRLAFTLARPGPVRLAVFDRLGREVAMLADGEVPAGRHEAVLDGVHLAAGLYLVRLTTGAGSTQTRRVTLLR